MWRRFAQNLGILSKDINLVVDGGSHGFASIRCRFLREVVRLIFLLPGFEQLQPGGLQFLQLLLLGVFLSDIEIPPVDDVCRIPDGLDLRPEIPDPYAVVRHNFHAHSIGLEQLAYLKFLTPLIQRALRGFVRSQQQDRPELRRLADNIHLNFKQMFLYLELWIGIA